MKMGPGGGKYVGTDVPRLAGGRRQHVDHGHGAAMAVGEAKDPYTVAATTNFHTYLNIQFEWTAAFALNEGVG